MNVNSIYRFFSVAVAILVGIGAPLSALAQGVIASGTEKKAGSYVSVRDYVTPEVSTGTVTTSISWSLSTEGVLTISPLETASVTELDKKSTGNKKTKTVCAIPNYSTTDMAPWYKYSKEIKKVVIEEGITSVGNYAFFSNPANYTNCSEISLPQSLEMVCQYAFCRFSETALTIPDNVCYLGSHSFGYSPSLKSVRLPVGLIFCTEAFRDCQQLLSLDIPEGLRYLGYGSNSLNFYNCYRLGSTGTDKSRQFAEIKLPSTLKTITNRCFELCYGLKTMDIPVGVQTIGANDPWARCYSLENLTIGGQKGTIETPAFLANGACKVVDGVLYSAPKDATKPTETDYQTILCYPAAHGLAEYTILPGVTTVAYGAFMGAGNWNENYCTSLVNKTVANRLAKVNLPSTLKTIGTYGFYSIPQLTEMDFSVCDNSFTTIGSEAFYNCKKLASVTLSSKLTTINAGALSNCAPNLKLAGLESNENFDTDGYVIYEKANGVRTSVLVCLSSFPEANNPYVLPPTVTTIKQYAFRDVTSLKQVDLTSGGKGSLSTIGYGAFYGTGLQQVVLPNTVTDISGYAFASCYYLSKVQLPTNNSFKTIKNDCFRQCYSLNEIEIPAQVEQINYLAFYNCYSTDKKYTGGLKKITFAPGSKLKVLQYRVFEGCANLERIELPSEVTTIDYQAFKDCKKLSFVKIDQKIEAFGFQNFIGCGSLETMYINNVTPPRIQADSFDPYLKTNTPKCIVYVPCLSIKDYRAARYYTDFFVIESGEGSNFIERTVGTMNVAIAEGCEDMGTVDIERELSCETISENGAPVISATAKTGYELLYWSDGSKHVEPSECVVNGQTYTYADKRGVGEANIKNWMHDVIWTAYFEQSVYSVAVDSKLTNGSIELINAKDAGELHASFSGTATYGETILATVTPASGYELVKFVVKNSSTGAAVATTRDPETGVYSFSIPNSDVEVSASFKLIDHKITVNCTAGGSAHAELLDAPGVTVTTANYRKKVQIVASPAKDFKLTSFSVRRADNNAAVAVTDDNFDMPNASVVVSVEFMPIDYRVPVGGKFIVGDFEYTVLALEPQPQVSIAARTDVERKDLVIPESFTVAYNSVTYDIVSVTCGGFVRNVPSVTFPSETPLSLDGCENVFFSNVEIIIPCGAKQAYVAEGYDKNGNSFGYISQYPFVVTVDASVNGTATVNKQPDCDDHSAIVVATPAEGYEFDKWNGNSALTNSTLVLSDVVANTRVSASFKPIVYQIVAESSPLGSITVGTSATIGTPVSVAVAPIAGFRLDKVTVIAKRNGEDYEVEFNKSTGIFVMPASDVRVSASYVAVPYDVVVATVNNGAVTPSALSATVGETVTLSAVPEIGYVQSGAFTVVGNADKKSITVTGNSFVMPAQSVTVSAKFVMQTYTVSINTPANGVVSLSKTSAKYNDEIKVTATPHSEAGSNYVLESIVASYGTGNDKHYVSVNQVDGTFKMPAANVGVVVTFGEAGAFAVGNKFTVGNFTYTVSSVAPFEVSVKAREDNPSLSGVSAIELNNTVTYLGQKFDVVLVEQGGFTSCEDLVQVKSNFDTPIPMSGKAFRGGLVLSTPCGTTGVYKSAGYDNFSEYEQIDNDPFVVTVKSNDEKLGTVKVVNQQWCSLNANIVAVPSKGCYFVKWSDGEIAPAYQLRLESNKTLTATFAKVDYNVNVVVASNSASVNTGSVDVAPTANYAQDVNISFRPAAGYSLKSVSVSQKVDGEDVAVDYSGDKASGAFSMPDNNVTVTVEYEPLTYNITCQSVEGGTITAPSVGVFGTRIPVSAQPATGYEFDEPLSAKADGNVVPISNGQFSMPAADVVVSASFKLKEFNVSVDPNMQNGSLHIAKSKAKMGDVVEIFSIAPIDGYELSSISLSDDAPVSIAADKKSASFSMPAHDVVISASFVPALFRITATSVEGGSYSVPSSARFGAEVNISGITPAVGYKFVDITTDKVALTLADDKKSAKFKMPASDLVITPVFDFIDFDVVVNQSVGGSVSANPTAHFGETVNMTIAPSEGYKLVSVVVKDDSNNSCEVSVSGDVASFEMPASNVKVNPEFTLIEYTVTVDGVPNGLISVDGGKTSCVARMGDAVRVSCFPAPGFHFTALYANGKVINVVDDKFTMPAADVVLTADFSKTGYGLSVEDVEGGTIEIERSTAEINDVVALTVKPNIGYEFVSYSLKTGSKGTLSDVDPKTLVGSITMADGSAVIVPFFRKVNYSVAFSSNVPSCSVSVSSASANYQDDVQLTFTAARGYELLRVSSSDVDLDVARGASSASFKMPAHEVAGSVVFQMVDYAIKVYDSEHGSVSAPASAHYGDVVTLVITPDPGYELDNLEVSNGAWDPKAHTLTMTDMATEVTASFRAVDYRITTEYQHGAVVCPETAKYLATVTLNLTPDKGYHATAISSSFGEGSVTLAEDGLSATLVMIKNSNVTVTVTFSKIDYTVTFLEADNGSIVSKDGQSTTVANYEDVVPIVVQPADHYVISSIATTSGVVSNVDGVFSLKMSDSDAKLTPTFVKKQYPIVLSFNSENGKLFAPETAGMGDEVVVSISPARGCLLDVNSFKVEGASCVLADNLQSATLVVTDVKVVVSAKFVKADYVLTVEGADASNADVNVRAKACYSDEVTGSIKPHDGYQLVALSIDGANVPEENLAEGAFTFTMPDHDVVISATIEAKTFEISVDKSGNGTVRVDANAVFGEYVTIETLSASDGYEFSSVSSADVKVSLDEETGKYGFTMPAHDVQLKVVFSILSYDVEIADVVGGKLTAAKRAQYASTVSVSVAPDAGYRYVSTSSLPHVSTTDAEGGFVFSMPAQSVSLTPLFEKIDYNITVDGGVTNGSVSVVDNRTTAQVGDAVGVVVTPAAGFHLVNFTVNNVSVELSSDGTFTMPAADAVISATFSKTGYGIVIASVEGGVVSAERYEANIGDRISLAISPATGYKYESMSVSGSATISDFDAETMTAVLTMPAENVTVTPLFSKIDYKVSFTANDGNTVTPSVSTANYGETVSLEFGPKRGYHLESVSADGVEIDLESGSFTMPAANVVGEAVFAKTLYNVVIFKSQNGSVDGESSATFEEEVSLAIAPQVGYKLKTLTATTGNLVVAADSCSATLTMTDADTEVEAVFEKSPLAISYIVADNGVISGQPWAYLGSTVTVDIVPEEGFVIQSIAAVASGSSEPLEVAINESGTVATFTMPASPVALTPAFALRDLSVFYRDALNGRISGDVEAHFGDDVVVTIEPDEDYHLESLVADYGEVVVADDQKFAILTMDVRDATLTASFERNLYPIVLHAGEHGAMSSITTQASKGDKFVVNVTPDMGYHLDESSFSVTGGKVVDADGLSFTIEVVSTSVDVYASFAKTDYAITVSGDVNGSVDVVAVAHYADEVSVSVSAAEGHELASIMIDGKGYELNADGVYSFLMPASDVEIKVVFRASEYEIIVVEAEGGNITTPAKADFGAEVTITAFKPHKGYRFVDLESDEVDFTLSEDGRSATFVMPASSVTLTPVFEMVDYLVKVQEADGGTVTADVSSARYANDVTLTVTPAKGYALVSLSTDPVVEMSEVEVGGNSFSFSMPDADITVTPVFARRDFKIIVDPEIVNGSLTVVGGHVSACVGDEVGVTLTPSEGYHLVNFTVNGKTVSLSADGTFTMPASDVVLSAYFSIDTYSISVEAAEGGRVLLDATVASEGDVVGLRVEPLEGYQFESLQLAEGLKSELSVVDVEKLTAVVSMAAENVVLIARFSKVSYDVVLVVSEGGSATPSAVAAQMGDAVTASISADEGYRLKGVTSDDVRIALATDKMSFSFRMPAHSVTANVAFERERYKVNVLKADHGYVTSQANAIYGANVSVSVYPDKGYALTGLKVSGSSATIADDGRSAVFAMPSHDVDIEPVFEKVAYPLVYQAAANGSVSGPESAFYGDVVTLSIAPAKGYELVSLSSSRVFNFDYSADRLSASFTMPYMSCTFFVSFRAVEYKIVYADAQGGTISGAKSAFCGESVKVNVVPADGYRLESLTATSGDLTLAADSASATLVVDAADVTLTATFVELPEPEPIVPDDPSDPDEPGDPDQPVDPENPEDPDEPVDPENPDQPQEPVDPEEPIEPEEPCHYYDEAPAVSLYDWLLMVDKNAFSQMGYEIAGSDVTWYRAVGDADDPCADNYSPDDDMLGSGLYFTSDVNLLGSGVLYAVVNVGDRHFRTQLFDFSHSEKQIMLSPTKAGRGQALRLRGLDGVAQVEVYDTAGRLIRTLSTDGGDVYCFDAEDSDGVYVVRIIVNGEKTVVKYVVK